MSDELDADEESRTTATGLARYATDYLRAACVVREHMPMPKGLRVVAPMPAYFLALQSIELILKAYLRHHGMSAKQLRSKHFRHDIWACYRKAKELGLKSIVKLSPAEAWGLVLLVRLNDRQGLRYIRTGTKEIGPWADIDSCALKLQTAIAPLTGYRAFAIEK